ncbi:hypothetical protein F5877DRAFT_72267 [Lentinula edodes]|nr:hypothetical protein F5877DRAFT_72267 [Lentinula edodes]
MERLAAVEQQEKEKELSKEAEKKPLPIYGFQKGVGVDSIPLQLHPYAKKMMSARKYVPLWYFLPDAALEAKECSKDSLDTNHLHFAVEDSDNPSGSTVSLVGSHTVMRAKRPFLNALNLRTWPDNYILMFAAFYINMDMHRELQEQDGDRVMAHYHAEMRMAWYDAMERKEPFDLSVISDRVLAESRREIVKQRQEKNLKVQHKWRPELMPSYKDSPRQLRIPHSPAHDNPQAKHAKLPIPPPPPAKPASKQTTRISSVPFGTRTTPHSRAVTGASDATSMTFDTAHEHQPGMENTEPTPDKNSAQIGNDLTVAQAEPTLRNTAAPGALAPVMELTAALRENSTRANTPLRAEAWLLAMSELNLSAKYPTLVESIWHGFTSHRSRMMMNCPLGNF